MATLTLIIMVIITLSQNDIFSVGHGGGHGKYW